jgi:hypothetical protein
VRLLSTFLFKQKWIEKRMKKLKTFLEDDLCNCLQEGIEKRKERSGEAIC